MGDRLKYPHFNALPQLVADRVVSARPHPRLPLTIYNYTIKAQMTPVAGWTQPMKDCRGLILDNEGYVVGRSFPKFWNMEQVLDQIPTHESFTVWEKVDGSLGIVCSYAGERVVATRGSFESDQAEWFRQWMDAKHKNFTPSGETWLFEIIYPENRIVVDYGKRSEGVLLAIMAPDGVDITDLLGTGDFKYAKRFDGITDFSIINSDPRFTGEEGFVVQWASGFRAKVKAEEYKRLHRLITQCSTRTIWELLRSGGQLADITDRVPEEFKQWVDGVTNDLIDKWADIKSLAKTNYDYYLHESRNDVPPPTRKSFAEWAKQQSYPQLLFALLDGKSIDDACWKLVEPKWATPFRKESEDV